MKLTVLLGLVALLAACGGGSNEAASSGTEPSAGTTTAATLPSPEDRAQLLAYDASAPLGLVERKAKSMKGAEVSDVVFDAGDRKVSAFLVRPEGKPKAAV